MAFRTRVDSESLTTRTFNMTNRVLTAGALVAALVFPVLAMADETGLVGGAAAGAVGGAVVGGPVGAVVGGIGGAALGNAMTNHRHYHHYATYHHHSYHNY